MWNVLSSLKVWLQPTMAASFSESSFGNYSSCPPDPFTISFDWLLDFLEEPIQFIKNKVEGKQICQYCECNLTVRKGGKKKTEPRPYSLFCEAEFKYLFCKKECHMNYLKHYRDCQNVRRCLLRNCSKKRYYDRSRGFLDYCGRNHADMHAELMRVAWNQDEYHSTGSKASKKQSPCNPKVIKFYERHVPYYEFTNFADYPVEIDGVQYPTTEHYFQSQKLIGTPYCAQIVALPYPRQAFEYPRQPEVSYWIRKDWEKIKENVMYKALYYKFKQHQYLTLLLMNTRDAILKEDSPYDSYWGIGADGNGKNRLGYLLMSLRNYLIIQFNQCAPLSQSNPINLPILSLPIKEEADVQNASTIDKSFHHVPQIFSETGEHLPPRGQIDSLSQDDLSPNHVAGNGCTVINNISSLNLQESTSNNDDGSLINQDERNTSFKESSQSVSVGMSQVSQSQVSSQIQVIVHNDNSISGGKETTV